MDYETFKFQDNRTAAADPRRMQREALTTSSVNAEASVTPNPTLTSPSFRRVATGQISAAVNQ